MTTGLRVQRKACATCIYRPDSPLDLAQLEAAIADPHLAGFFEGYRVCHHSEHAVCAGFWQRHKDHFTGGQLAQRLTLVRFVQDDTQPTTPERKDPHGDDLPLLPGE